MNWFAVHTKPRKESVAQETLQREGIETFYPKLRRRRTIRRVRRWVTGPLFPCYVFVRFEFPRSHRLVQYANGVTNIVSFGGKPAVVADSIITEIKDHCGGDAADTFHDTVVLPPTPFRPGERVEIKSGPFMGLQGVFERELSDSERVVILLEILARGARVQVSREDLEKIDTD